MSPRPLDGLRVLNFGWFWVCALIGGILSDMGAEVIKIESKRRMEPLKFLPPFLGDIQEPDRNFWTHNISRNSRSVLVDLERPEARALVHDLVRQSDVVLENFTPGTMAKLGLDYASLSQVRPDLVMISATTAGQTGPLRAINTFGNVLSCLAGVDALQGYPGEEAIAFGTAEADPLFGMMGAYAVVSALRRRARTGAGCYIDFGEWEGVTSTLGGPLLDYLWNGRVRAPQGNRDPLMAPHGVYPCRPAGDAPGEDRWLAIACRTEAQWRALVRLMGDPAWARDRRFADAWRRKRHEDALDAHIAEWTRPQRNYDLAEQLQAAGVPAFPALSTAELYTDPHFAAREDWVDVDHPLGRERMYGVAWKLSETPGRIERPLSLMGADNEYIFSALLGLPPARVRELEQVGVLA